MTDFFLVKSRDGPTAVRAYNSSRGRVNVFFPPNTQKLIYDSTLERAPIPAHSDRITRRRFDRFSEKNSFRMSNRCGGGCMPSEKILADNIRSIRKHSVRKPFLLLSRNEKSCCRVVNEISRAGNVRADERFGRQFEQTIVGPVAFGNKPIPGQQVAAAWSQR